MLTINSLRPHKTPIKLQPFLFKHSKIIIGFIKLLIKTLLRTSTESHLFQYSFQVKLGRCYLRMLQQNTYADNYDITHIFLCNNRPPVPCGKIWSLVRDIYTTRYFGYCSPNFCNIQQYPWILIICDTLEKLKCRF